MKNVPSGENTKKKRVILILPNSTSTLFHFYFLDKTFRLESKNENVFHESHFKWINTSECSVNIRISNLMKSNRKICEKCCTSICGEKKKWRLQLNYVIQMGIALRT